jgi:hypothetical protein
MQNHWKHWACKNKGRRQTKQYNTTQKTLTQIANPYNLRTLCMTVIILVVGTFRLSFTFFISETQPQYFTMSIQCNPVKGLGCVWCLTF